MKKYIVKTLNSMATGLFASLLIGLILEQLGVLLGSSMLQNFGMFAKTLMGPAIGIAIAASLDAPPLVLTAAAVAGALGAGTIQLSSELILATPGEPVGAYVAALAATEVGKRISGKTPVDIILSPAITILVGGLTAIIVSPAVSKLMTSLGAFINEATTLHPFLMGIIVSVAMGMILTLPISSAAIAISLKLSGLAAGAATVGCCCQMIGFAVSSFKDNKWGGALAQGIGTSMLQMPNIIENWRIWIPPTLASAILGPVATMIFKMENIPTGAGMGTSGLVGQIGTIAAMGTSSVPAIILLHFLLPGIISALFTHLLIKISWIKPGDMKLKV